MCLNPFQPKFQDLPFVNIFLSSDKLGDVEVEWNKLTIVDWKKVFKGNIPAKSEDFWPEVLLFQDAGGTYVFSNLAVYVLTVLSLPSSNAVVERTFSVMNSIKTKSRNRMLIALLDAILRIRIRFTVNKICCKDFKPSRNMFQKFTYKVVYPFKNKTDNSDLSNQEEEFNNNALTAFNTLSDNVEFPCIHLPDGDI